MLASGQRPSDLGFVLDYYEATQLDKVGYRLSFATLF